jgi:hypothetical protein
MALIVVLSACGYRFAVPYAPAGVKSVSVPVFRNATTEPHVDALCTQALREYYRRAGLLGGEGSDATVEGVVQGVTSSAFLAAPERGPFPTYRLSGSVRLTLRQRGQPPRELVVSGTEEYPSGADVLLTESYRATALRRWCDALMQEGAERLSDARR